MKTKSSNIKHFICLNRGSLCSLCPALHTICMAFFCKILILFNLVLWVFPHTSQQYDRYGRTNKQYNIWRPLVVILSFILYITPTFLYIFLYILSIWDVHFILYTMLTSKSQCYFPNGITSCHETLKKYPCSLKPYIIAHTKNYYFFNIFGQKIAKKLDKIVTPSRSRGGECLF